MASLDCDSDCSEQFVIVNNNDLKQQATIKSVLTLENTLDTKLLKFSEKDTLRCAQNISGVHEDCLTIPRLIRFLNWTNCIYMKNEQLWLRTVGTQKKKKKDICIYIKELVIR